MKQEDRLTNPFCPTRKCADEDGVIREYKNPQYIDCELYKEKSIKLRDKEWVKEVNKCVQLIIEADSGTTQSIIEVNAIKQFGESLKSKMGVEDENT